MPRRLQSLIGNRHGFAVMLAMISWFGYLAWPVQQFTLLPQAIAASREKAEPRYLSAPISSGALSFTAPTFSANEGDAAGITLTRTGGSDNQVVAKVTLADVTTSPTDYRFLPGALDTSLNPALGADGAVYAVAEQADGKIVIGGSFSNYNGAPANRIARLNPDGSLDSTFNPGGSGISTSGNSLRTIVIQSDGKILIGGFFKTYNGVACNSIVRLNANGSLDPTFDPGTGPAPDSFIVKLGLQQDNKIVIAGGFTSFNGTSRNHIARLNSDGSLDGGFDPGTGSNGSLNTLALQADGSILIGGFFTNYNGTAVNHIARILPNGTLDTSFNSGTILTAGVLAIAPQADGKIIVGGSFNTGQGSVRNYVVRLTASGSVDTTFDSGTSANADVQDIGIQADGKIIIGGTFTSYNGTFRNRIARLNPDGALDLSFNPGVGATGGAAQVLAILLQGDGHIIIAGSFTTYNNTSRMRLARLEGDLFVTWPAGDATNKTVSLPIVDDFVDESDETLTLTLTPLIGGATTGTYSSATLTIIDAPPTLIQLSMTGEQGDYIGGANNYFYPQSDGNFIVSGSDNSGDGSVDSVSISFNQTTGGGHWWYLAFNTYRVPGTNLLPGYYPDAQRAAFTSTGHPGLDISGDGRGCNTLTGSFTVHESQFDYSSGTPKVVKFTASFEQHCDGDPAALVGTIYYRYTGSSPSYAVTGRIVDSNGNGLASAPVKLGGSRILTTNTDSLGNYSFSDLIGGGNFIVAPSPSANVIFSPTSQLIKRLSGNQTADFTAIPLYSISGKISDNNGAALTAVQVSLTGSKSATAFTDNSGNYTFTGLRADGNYTLTPSRQYYVFSPQNRTFTTLPGNQTSNFTGTRLTYSLAGKVTDALGTGMSGVTLNLSGTQTATTQTDSLGNYSFANVLAGGNYAVTPVRTNYSFTQPSQSVFGLTGNVNFATFIGRLVNWGISGVLLDENGNPISNASLALSGSTTGATTSAANGSYLFVVQAEGNYTVTPSKSNYTFSPVNRVFNNLSANQTGNFIGTGMRVQFTSSSYSVSEGDGYLAALVTRTGNTSGSAAVDFATSDAFPISKNCQDASNGIASSRCDYATTIGTLQFAAGELSKTIVIPIVDDNIPDGNESFTIALSNPSGAILGTSAASATIVDNANTAGNPIDANPFFVNQHYIDLLGRLPDQGGYNAWLGILGGCGTTVAPPCDRIEVSSAFFRSEEFQSRGYFVYRLYSAVGKIPLYEQFMPDFARVSGFLSDQQKESNKVALVNDFMTRSDFQTLYGGQTAPTAYVDALLQTVGFPDHASRQPWIDGLTNGSLTRAQVFRAVAELPEVYTKYYNEAFVIMQYFGYLRRSADISYLNWIQTMNQTGGDYRTMINGFLNSVEYRTRFGL
jgi:uncharacterized delta-60 repeat protein